MSGVRGLRVTGEWAHTNRSTLGRGAWGTLFEDPLEGQTGIIGCLRSNVWGPPGQIFVGNSLFRLRMEGALNSWGPTQSTHVLPIRMVPGPLPEPPGEPGQKASPQGHLA